MPKIFSTRRKITILGFALVLVIVVLQVFTPVQASSALETRVYRLESENFELRSRLGRLESQISGASVGQAVRPSPRSNRSAPSLDARFDRLATLVIELKEQVDGLQARLSKLEARVPSQTRP